jgi:hypothetical protein
MNEAQWLEGSQRFPMLVYMVMDWRKIENEVVGGVRW